MSSQRPEGERPSGASSADPVSADQASAGANREPLGSPANGSAPGSPVPRSPTEDFLVLLLILLAAGAAFLPSLAGEFVFDEHNLVLGNHRLGRLAEIPASFFRLEEETAVVTHQVGTVGRYRPLPSSLAILAYAAFKVNPLWWHVVNLSLYLLTITALYSIYRQLSPNPWIYRPATLFFALHPVHTEVVGWVALFGNTLLGLGFAMALWFHLRFRETGTRLHLLLSLAFLQVALFSRETALIFPLVVFALEWVYGQDGFLTRIRTAFSRTLPALAGIGFYLLVRFLALGGSLRMSVTASVPWWPALLSIPEVILADLRLLFVPLGLSPVYPFAWVGAPDDPRFWGGLLAIAALLFLLVHLLTGQSDDPRPGRFAIGATALCLLPFLHLRALSPELILQDRYLFLSSIGSCLLLALLAREACRRGNLRPGSAAALVLLVAFGLGWLSYRQSFVWRNDLSLFQRAVSVSPRSSLANQNLGMAFLQNNHLDEARTCFNISISLGNLAAGYAGLGDVAFASGDYSGAVNSYEQSLHSAWSFSANLLRNLGLAYFQTGDEEQALRSFDLLASHFPENHEGYLHSGLLRLKRQEFGLAVERLRQAQILDPGNFNIPFFMGEAYDGLGDKVTAARYFKESLALAPGFKRAQARLQELSSPTPPTGP